MEEKLKERWKERGGGGEKKERGRLKRKKGLVYIYINIFLPPSVFHHFRSLSLHRCGGVGGGGRKKRERRKKDKDSPSSYLHLRLMGEEEEEERRETEREKEGDLLRPPTSPQMLGKGGRGG